MSDLPARPAREDDYAAFAGFFAELGTGDPTPSEETWAREIAPRALILERSGRPVGYGWAVVLDGVGYVYNVVVHPEERGRGVGRAVMDALADRLREEGCTTWCLNVKVDNAPAIRLYERCGMQKAHNATALLVDWDCVGRLPRDEGAAIAAEPFTAAHDAALEAAFDVPRGRLASQRALGRVVFVRLFDRGDPRATLAFACFDPTFPGASPFRVARPTLARPLLEALAPHARPDDRSLKLVLERDVPTVEALRAAGATVRLDLWHMRGDLPA